MLKNLWSRDEYGAEVLTLASVGGATLLLLAAITAPASYQPAAPKAAAAIETVTVTANHHIS